MARPGWVVKLLSVFTVWPVRLVASMMGWHRRSVEHRRRMPGVHRPRSVPSGENAHRSVCPVSVVFRAPLSTAAVGQSCIWPAVGAPNALLRAIRMTCARLGKPPSGGW